MEWEKLTVSEFAQGVEDSKGVCVLPLGCMEKHGDHLPIGTDVMIARTISLRAAERECAMVFPSLPYGQVSEVRHMKGTVAIDGDLQFALLRATCDEIARNGFDKIVIGNGHGGNITMLSHFARTMMDKPHPYAVYVVDLWQLTAAQKRQFDAQFPPVDEYGHGDIDETSFIMSVAPSLVHMERHDPAKSRSLHRSDALEARGVDTGIEWYMKYPDQHAGDATGASAERGAALAALYVDNFAAAIKAIKDDDSVLRLQREFYDACDHPGE